MVAKEAAKEAARLLAEAEGAQLEAEQIEQERQAAKVAKQAELDRPKNERIK